MAAYYKKTKDEIIRQSLKKLTEKTPFTATGPGSVVRSLIEVITEDLGDYYAILDYNMSQSVVSTATGRALDLLGDLYNVRRKRLTDLATVDAAVGAFYFYVTNPLDSDLSIPGGTRVYTNLNDQLGKQYFYVTTEAVTLLAGRSRVYAPLRPLFEDSVFTAGVGTLVNNDLDAPIGVDLLCTNPKVISPQIGYESDANYRSRIIKSIRAVSGGTLDGLRWLALSLTGVRDVRITSANYGLGSFEVIVTAEDYRTIDQLLDNVFSLLDSYRPVGVRMVVKAPTLKSINVDAQLVLKPGRRFDDAVVTRRAELGALRYINTLLIGDTLVYNQLIQSIIDSSDVISDVVITRYSVNGQEVLRKNYQTEFDSQLIPGNVAMRIAS